MTGTGTASAGDPTGTASSPEASPDAPLRASPVSPVTAALDLRLPDAALDEAVRVGLGQVERRLLQAVTQADRLADDASRHLVVAGGKRVRPMLTLIAGHLGEPAGPRSSRPASPSS